jgi:NADH dehydrogenase
MPGESRPQIVVLGAGFGGLWAVRGLVGIAADVLLLDRDNFHVFTPLLYQVAAAELEPEEIVYPVRTMLRKARNVRFAMTEVAAIDLDRKRVRTAQREVAYDYLVIGAGSVPNYFGVPGAEEHALPLKSQGQAIRVRNNILCCFERAVTEPNAGSRRRLLTFVVVGGGPTGVEFAGALAELVRGPLSKDYPALNLGEVRIVLLEAAGRLLGALPAPLGDYARYRLEQMGVEVRLETAVGAVGSDGVSLRGGEALPSATVVWTAGVRGEPRVGAWGLPAGRGGQVPVEPTLQLPGHPEVYVVGDLAGLTQDAHPLPMVAPVAIQEGEAAARNIARQIRGQAPEPFRYRDRGTMATIGRNAAVAELAGRTFTGFPAWIVWLTVHIFNLIGLRNRFLVLVNWAWDYLFFERGVRLVMPADLCPRPF